MTGQKTVIERQIVGDYRELEKDAWIIANGYNILRLGETLIRKEIDKCIKKIKEKINWGLTWKKSMK